MQQTIETKEKSKSHNFSQAQKWFDIWGRVERERLVTGDKAAVPMFAGDAACGSESSPSDPSASILTHADVDMWLRREAWPMARMVAAFVHVFSPMQHDIEHDCRSGQGGDVVVYTLCDGSKTDPLPESAPPPHAFTACEIVRSARPRIRWQEFGDEQTRQWCRLWGYGAGEFGEWQHRRLLREFARAKGVDGFSR